MSEVQSRPSAPRGRGSARGGRGGFASRGGRGGRSHATNGDRSDNTPNTSIEDDGEVGQLKKKHGSKVDSIKDVFPGWTDEDAVMALEETDGDLETTIERIADGTITQWGEVSKGKKDKSKSKPKESTIPLESNTRPSRGARGGFEAGRGGRGRGSDRGRGSVRGRGGAAVAPTNGARTTDTTELSVPTTESSAWETSKDETPAWGAPTEKPSNDTWGGAAANVASSTAVSAAAATTSIIPEGVKKSWASMFAKPEPAPAPKAAPSPAPAPALALKSEEPVKAPEPVEAPAAPEPEPVEPTPAAEEAPVPEVKESTPAESPALEESEPSITPSKDELTETNLEQVLDTSHPAPTATAASTAASSWDPRNTGATNTPYVAVPQQSARPAPASGFVASALKATGTSGRTSSYQRRVLDQEEAVRMPGNRAVDSTAVQFGAFNLNGSGDEDVDGDREEPETRAQPPQHSPVAHPRASLPPSQQAPGSETYPTPKQAPGLPSAPQQTSAPGLPSPQGLPAAQSMSQQGSQSSHQYSGQFGRFGQSGSQPQGNTDLKEYDAFSRQVPTSQSPYDAYPSQPGQGQQGAFSSAPSDYSSYYTADQHQRNAYQNYYGAPYGQQPGAQSQDGPGAAQRTFSGYGAPQSETTSQYPQSSGPQSQSRYTTAGETQGSGHTTPNPTTQAQHQPGQTAAPQQSHPQQGGAGQYPYGHPYYSSPYYAAYMNQHYQGYGQGAYGGGPYGAKGGMYNQPQQGYGMSPATPYDHASSPAAGSFGGASLHGRDSALGGLGDYGRTGSAQSSQAPQAIGGGAFGGMHDTFGRNSSYQGQNQHYGQQGAQQSADADLKPFGESKTANGPSPSLTQAARPGSATSGTPGQTGLPPPQSSQQGYSGYPSHLQQHALHGSQSGSQYGGLGGLGGHQAGHQNSQYGGYQGFGNSYYGNNQQRGGWGGNYGH